jgi:hypothetical protein
MVTPELISYLEECERQGVKKEQAMSALLGAGWKLAHIQEGIKIVSARQEPMPRPRYLFPVFQLSLSLLFIIVLGTSGVVLVQNYVSSVSLGGSENLQANVSDAIVPADIPQASEAALLEQQINKISNISDALEIYKELTGRYPRKLEELQKTAEEILNSSSSTTPIADHDRQYLLGLYGTRALYEQDFIDLFNNSPFLYSAPGDRYSLSYLLRWKSPQSSTIENQFINGWNTATKDSLSASKHGSE